MIVKELYQCCCKNGWTTPDAFWRMTPTELWWLVEAHRKPPDYGRLTEDEVRELYEEAYGD